MAGQVPSVGRVVHYVAYGTPGGEFPAGAHRAAIITQVDNIGLDQRFIDFPEVSLCVLNPTGMFFNSCIPFDPTGQQPGSWHWPEYVPAKVDHSLLTPAEPLSKAYDKDRFTNLRKPGGFV